MTDFEQLQRQHMETKGKLEAELAKLQNRRVTEAELDRVIASNDPIAELTDLAMTDAVIPLLRKCIQRCSALEQDARTMSQTQKRNQRVRPAGLVG